jgi:RNA polymerase sigma-70 factor, ECF subfamily
MEYRKIIQDCLESGSDAAWTVFVRQFQPVIASVILRAIRRYSEANHALVDDLVQETFLRLCRNNFKAIRDFEHRRDDSILGYLKVVAASVTMDHFRARKTRKRAGEVEDLTGSLLENAPAPDSGIEGALLVRQVSDCLNRISTSERDRTVFWLYYLQGCSAKEISAIPGVNLSPKGVESSLFRMTQALRQALQPSLLEKMRKREGALPSSTLGGMG